MKSRRATEFSSDLATGRDLAGSLCLSLKRAFLPGIQLSHLTLSQHRKWEPPASLRRLAVDRLRDLAGRK